MRKLILMSILLTVFFIVSGCNDHSVKQIKADYFDIGFGQSLYEGLDKVDEETVQMLVKAYNEIKYSGKTNQEINFEKAITITFIYNDKISGSLVIDDNGVFHIGDRTENYQIDSNNDFYELAIEVYNDLKNRY